MLNSYSPASSGSSAQINKTFEISVYNAGESTIAIGTAVNIVGSPVEIDDPSPCLPFFDENMPWGVVSNSIDTGECCSCVVSGPVKVQINDTGGDYAEPDPNNPELFKTAQNGVPIVTRTKEYAVINLGGGSAVVPQNEYYGMFKLVAMSTVSVKIVNGYNSASSYCGATDVPGLNTIPVTELLLDDKQEWKIYLAFFYDTDTKTYSAEFVTELPGTEVFSQLIGTFRRGKVDQIYRLEPGVGRMIFGEDWYLK
jgi:hypothetical protein